MKTSISHWAQGLLAGIITGSATSFLSAVGIGASNTVGVSIPNLSLRQIAVLTIIGGLVGAAAYLKQSPLPPDDEEPPPPPQIPSPKLPFLLLPLTVAGLVLTSGCATTGISPESVNSYVTNNSSLLTKATAAASSFALALAEKDPVARQQLKDDINQIVEKVARGLDAASSATGGTITPDQLADDLKVRDATAKAFLDAVVVLYREGYEKLEASGRVADALPWAKLILNSMNVLAKGLEKATK